MKAERRLAMPEKGVRAADLVRSALDLRHPAELEIEVVAHMRGALVRPEPTTGAKASLVRIGSKGIIGVADLPFAQQRWAIAHELGHFELHLDQSYLGLCTGDDLRFALATALGTSRRPMLSPPSC